MTELWSTMTRQAEQVLPVLLQMELQLSLVILVALALDSWLKNAGCRFRYALWVVVLVKALWPPKAAIPYLVVAPQNPISLPQVAMQPSMETPAGLGISPWAVILLIWVSTSIALFGYMVFSGLSFRFRLSTRRSRPWQDSTIPLPEGQQWPPIWKTEGIHSPLTIGLFRPRIHLNNEATKLRPAALLAVLYHELAHIRRRDGWVTLLQTAALVVHPINPLVLVSTHWPVAVLVTLPS